MGLGAEMKIGARSTEAAVGLALIDGLGCAGGFE